MEESLYLEYKPEYSEQFIKKIMNERGLKRLSVNLDALFVEDLYSLGYTLEFVEKALKERQDKGQDLELSKKSKRLDNLPTNLDFLKTYDFLEELSIGGIKDFNFRFLQHLPRLRHLNISHVGKMPLELSHLVNLETFWLNWRKNIIGLDKCTKLKELQIWDYKEPSFTAIPGLESLKNLKVLDIRKGSIKSLQGIEPLENLEELSLGYCTYLTTIALLNGKQNLKSLKLHACSKIQDYDSLTDLPNLEVLEINHCKDIPSIKFIENFPSLKKLRLLENTNVVDGDMSYTNRIKDVLFTPRKHYSETIHD